MYKFNPNKLKVIYRQEINKKLLEEYTSKTWRNKNGRRI